MQGVDRARLASAGGDEGGPRSGGCADHGGRCGLECAQGPANAAPGNASSHLPQASRPISRGSLLDNSVAAQHRLEIGICALERPGGEEILQVSFQLYFNVKYKFIYLFEIPMYTLQPRVYMVLDLSIALAKAAWGEAQAVGITLPTHSSWVDSTHAHICHMHGNPCRLTSVLVSGSCVDGHAPGVVPRHADRGCEQRGSRAGGAQHLWRTGLCRAGQP